MNWPVSRNATGLALLRVGMPYRASQVGMAAACAWGLLVIVAPARAAFTPKSPEVQTLIKKGINYVEKTSDPRVGAKALFGLTLLKADLKRDHPVVSSALEAVRGAAGSKASLESLDVYSVGLCLIFLAECDPEGLKPEIQTYLDHLISIQKPHGGWGYRDRTTGDTSMTQYGVLALWEAEHAGFKPPQEAWEKVAEWLIRTQDPKGPWGYQGTDPGSYKLVDQSLVRHSMASAGLGSLYICADHFKYRRGGPREDAGTPSVLQRVRKAQAPQQPVPTAVVTRLNLGRLGEALDRGDKWMQENYKIDPPEYTHYFLYAFERYQSFREVSSSTPFKPSHWYDDGVYYLTKNEGADGSWSGTTGNSTDTCFALLFLLRSSQKSIERVHHLGPGTLITGRGLPSGNDIELRMGQVRQKPLAGPAEQLLAAIEDPGHPDYLRAVEGLEEKVDRAPPVELGRLAGRLRSLAGSDEPEARAAAVRALGRTRDLNNAPIIIAALSDPDDDVFLAAEETLQFMTRSISNPAENEGITPARRAGAVRKWRNWFLSIRPNAKLEE
jgi:Prenyltransferase and squalene oxidase repeat